MKMKACGVKEGFFLGPALIAVTILQLAQIPPASAGPDEFATEVRKKRPKCHQFADGQGNVSDRMNSTMALEDLRGYLGNYYDGYVITWTNDHLMEFTGACENRLAAISGFPGKGYGLVTADRAAIFTAKVLAPLADRSLDCNWEIIETDSKDDLTVPQYLDKYIRRRGERQNIVAVDPSAISASVFVNWRSQLDKVNIRLGSQKSNLVDRVWRNRPPCPRNKVVYHLPTALTGQAWTEKVEEVRKELRDQLVDAILLSAPDEIAWLLNLRGKDFLYQELFRCYLFLDHNSVHLFAGGLEKDAERALRIKDCSGKRCVILHKYEDFNQFLETIPKVSDRILLPKQYGSSQGISQLIHETLDHQMGGRIKFVKSPIQDMKAVKSKVEIHGMKEASFKDSLAFVAFMAQLEQKIKRGIKITEHAALKLLERKREEQRYYVGNSFYPQSYYGTNTADPTYVASLKDSVPIGNDSVYMIDAGAHFREGTTDISRVLHFGEPQPYHKKVYTKVLAAHIELARAIFPEGTTDVQLDGLPRGLLYSEGLEYHHPTGHGIGILSTIHEGPITMQVDGERHELKENQIVTIEPAAYIPGKFGVRLQSEYLVVKKRSFPTAGGSFSTAGTSLETKTFLGFQPLTFVPFDPNLIDWKYLNFEQVAWLNRYNDDIRRFVGDRLVTMKQTLAYEWLLEKTKMAASDNCLDSYNSGGVNTSFLNWSHSSLLMITFAISQLHVLSSFGLSRRS